MPAKSIKLSNLKKQFVADDVPDMSPGEMQAFREEILYI